MDATKSEGQRGGPPCPTYKVLSTKYKNSALTMHVSVEEHAHVLDLDRVHDQNFGEARVDQPSGGVGGFFYHRFFFLASKRHPEA